MYLKGFGVNKLKFGYTFHALLFQFCIVLLFKIRICSGYRAHFHTLLITGEKYDAIHKTLGSNLHSNRISSPKVLRIIY